MSRIINLSDGDRLDFDKKGICILIFTVEWCPFCFRQKPILEEFASGVDESVTFYNVDPEGSPKLAERFCVNIYPSIFLLNNGSVQALLTGLQTRDQLSEAFRELKIAFK